MLPDREDMPTKRCIDVTDWLTLYPLAQQAHHLRPDCRTHPVMPGETSAETICGSRAVLGY